MEPTAAARLVALPPYRGVPGEFALDRERLVLGRDRGSDLALAGRGVSLRHAEIVRADGRWLVRDLDSTSGTSLSGRPVTAPVVLHDGDVLSLGDVRLLARGLDGPQPAADGAAPPTIPQPRGTTAGHRWSSRPIGGVDGVPDRDVPRQRESRLREAAATRTTARWFLWPGVALFIAGLGAAVYAVLVAFGQISAGAGGGVPPPDVDSLGGRFGPLMALGEVGTLGGALLIVVGIVLHVVATAGRRPVRERLTLPAPRPPSSP